MRNNLCVWFLGDIRGCGILWITEMVTSYRKLKDMSLRISDSWRWPANRIGTVNISCSENMWSPHCDSSGAIDYLLCKSTLYEFRRTIEPSLDISNLMKTLGLCSVSVEVKPFKLSSVGILLILLQTTESFLTEMHARERLRVFMSKMSVLLFKFWDFFIELQYFP